MCFTVEFGQEDGASFRKRFPGKGEAVNVRRKAAGGDAPGGHTRSHPEHDGQDPGGRWYYTGDGVGEQVAAGPPMGM